MNVIGYFKENTETNLIKNGFQRYNPNSWGMFYRVGQDSVDRVMSPSFNEGIGTVGVVVSKANLGIESILNLVIEDKIFRFATMLVSDIGQETFSFYREGALNASNYLLDKIFSKHLPEFERHDSMEAFYKEYKESKKSYLTIGKQKGKHSDYRALLFAKLYAAPEFDAIYKELQDDLNDTYRKHVNTTIRRDGISMLENHPVRSGMSKLGRLKLLLDLMDFSSFEHMKKDLINHFVQKIVR